MYKSYLEERHIQDSVLVEEQSIREWNFANDDGSNPYMKYAKQYVEHRDEVKKKGMGMLLWGDVGTGKSYMAACIANALLEQEKRVLMTNFTTISNGVFAAIDKNDYIESVCAYDLANLFYIVIGTHKEKGTLLYDVILSRYERISFTEKKIKTLLDMHIISAGAKLANGEIVVALLEKQKQSELTIRVNGEVV